jgi:menaquinone-dependent protoporphyrinogen oxidase
MEKKILVAYASKYGATKEIATKIGEELQKNGLQADVLPAGSIRETAPYQAVIFGSAIYIGNWPKEAAEFFKVNESALAEQPVWLFSSGPTGDGDPAELVNGKLLPASLQAIVSRIQPRDIAIFHGNINCEKINAMENWAIKNVVKKPFGDFRDWDMITGWTSKITEVLKKYESTH